MKDTKGYFNKLSADLDSALQKNAAASKSRPSEVEDATNLLTATQSCFRYTALDYVYQISMLQSRKRHEVLETLMVTVQASGDFFASGNAMFVAREGGGGREQKKSSGELGEHIRALKVPRRRKEKV